jgi:hypothetical protein
MYPGVPSTPPVLVDDPLGLMVGSNRPRDAVTGVVALAMPKSRSFTCPVRVRKTLSGLRSRWTMPWPLAAARAWAICTAHSSAWATGTGPRLSRSRSVSPWRSSVTT